MVVNLPLPLGPGGNLAVVPVGDDAEPLEDAQVFYQLAEERLVLVGVGEEDVDGSGRSKRSSHRSGSHEEVSTARTPRGQASRDGSSSLDDESPLKVRAGGTSLLLMRDCNQI